MIIHIDFDVIQLERLVISIAGPAEVDDLIAKTKLDENQRFVAVQRLIVLSNARDIGVILHRHVVDRDIRIRALKQRIAQGLRGRLIVDALIAIVDHRDRHALGHTLFEPERCVRAAGYHHITFPRPGGIVLAAAPGDAHLLGALANGGIGQTIDFSTRQRDPSMTKLINSASRCSRIILDGHIIHGQSRVRAHNDRIPDLLPDVVVDRLAVGGEGELERRVFIRRRFDARALGEGHRRRGRGRLVSIVALEADLDLIALHRDGGSNLTAVKIDPCAKLKLVLDFRILRCQGRSGVLAHDLLENGRAQRVVINGRGIRIRQRDLLVRLKNDVGCRAISEGHCDFRGSSAICVVAGIGNADLLIAFGNGGVLRETDLFPFQRRPLVRKAARRLRVILNGHVIDLQVGRGTLHDLVEDALAQRVKIDRCVRVVRQCNSNAFLERDGRNRLLCLIDLNFVRQRTIGQLQADRIAVILIRRQRRMAILHGNKSDFFRRIKTGDRPPRSVFRGNCRLALTRILPLTRENTILLLTAHLVKANDQRRRQNAVHILLRRSGRDNRRTVMQRVAAAIRCEHGRRERADLRQKQDRQQARQHPLQFFTCHDISSIVSISPSGSCMPSHAWDFIIPHRC